MENSDETRLAEVLGITVEELELLDYEISEDTSDDGHPHSTMIEFADGNPEEIMSRITDLESGRYVYLPVGFFDDDEG